MGVVGANLIVSSNMLSGWIARVAGLCCSVQVLR